MNKRMKAEFFLISMFPTVAIKDEILEKLLDVFESYEYFKPTLWGNNERIKVNYNRNEIIEKVATNQIGFSEVYLRRDKGPKYVCRFLTDLSSRSFFKIHIGKDLQEVYWPSIFDFSDKIAEIVRPNYGVTHIFWPLHTNLEKENEKNFAWMAFCSQPIPVNFVRSGPAGVGMRTYFSGRVMELFGKEFLLNVPSNVTKLEWGGIRIDLVDKPWEGDICYLTDRFVNVMNYLDQAQVLAIPSFDEQLRGATFSPNKAWERMYK